MNSLKKEIAKAKEIFEKVKKFSSVESQEIHKAYLAGLEQALRILEEA